MTNKVAQLNYAGVILSLGKSYYIEHEPATAGMVYVEKFIVVGVNILNTQHYLNLINYESKM